MKNYLKLVNFEINRFMKIYIVLIISTIILQVVGLFFRSQSYLSEADHWIYDNQLPIEEFLGQYGPMSMHKFLNTLWFIGSVALCVVTLLIYVFFIWYRDWLGKNTFIYRLLMLPTNRINIFLSKATSIFIFVLGLIALQLILFPIESLLLTWFVPDELRLDMNLLQIMEYPFMFVLFPKTILEFFINYGIGLIVVFVLFTFVLFERCFRLKGVMIGVVYTALSFVVFISPIFLNILLDHYFYPIELFGFVVFTGLLVITGSILTSYYLLNKKIRV